MIIGEWKKIFGKTGNQEINELPQWRAGRILFQKY